MCSSASATTAPNPTATSANICPWYRKRTGEITNVDRPVSLDQRRNRRLPARLHRRPQLVRDRFPQLDEARAAEDSARTIAAKNTAPTSSKRSRPAASIAGISTSSTTTTSPICPMAASSKSPATSIATASTCRLSATCRWPAPRPARPASACSRWAIEAAVHGDVTLLKQAMLHDPLVGAVCDPEEVWQMTDEMLVAQAQWLPQYQEEIPAAKKRLATHEQRHAREAAKNQRCRPPAHQNGERTRPRQSRRTRERRCGG